MTDKIDLRDTTFLMAIKTDHPDRKACLDVCLRWIDREFDTQVHVLEVTSPVGLRVKDLCDRIPSVSYEIHEDHDLDLHLTKWLNRLMDGASTPVVIVSNVDVVMPARQVLEAVQAVRQGATFVVPYDFDAGWHYMTDRFREDFARELDWRLVDDPSYCRGVIPMCGGIYAADRRVFRGRCGGENEDMVGYCASDIERRERVAKLGYPVREIRGPAYHLEHWRGVDSTGKNPDGSLTPLSWKMDTLLYQLRFEMDRAKLEQWLRTRPWFLEGQKSL